MLPGEGVPGACSDAFGEPVVPLTGPLTDPLDASGVTTVDEAMSIGAASPHMGLPMARVSTPVAEGVPIGTSARNAPPFLKLIAVPVTAPAASVTVPVVPSAAHGSTPRTDTLSPTETV